MPYYEDSSWSLDFGDTAVESNNIYDKEGSISTMSSISNDTRPVNEHSLGSDGLYNSIYDYHTTKMDDQTPLLHGYALSDNKDSMEHYLGIISRLNNDIEEFSKLIQTLALFKYYIRNRKSTTNISELHKRFNGVSANCCARIKDIQEQLAKLNHDNHYVMVHREALRFSYSDLRARFNLQDASVKKIKTLIDTYHSVIKEYTASAKRTLHQAETLNTASKATENASNIISEIDTRAKDIMAIEKNARDLSELYSELNMIIKKRGDNISSLEHQILLSAEQIEKGKEDISLALKERTNINGLYFMCVLVAVGTCFLIIPSHIRSIVFGD
ncbi:conserved hypothetical protein [Theileria equi strain WA]|uniref:t-SNARE coiled-coil homology domain-containing protein n=1 Tax=Theileria equi strain WA TaxID=1537102 RepID=L1LEK1_THEEQ|nr:conserved hypothetical protein [Theileria equi strain WA]EKX73751.1 conserved hypothetical protein [Theileria equi strain WA]|eukprot:XP_004833203.1 conserved hypothetical protein [Theileria equi strain WA]